MKASLLFVSIALSLMMCSACGLVIVDPMDGIDGPEAPDPRPNRPEPEPEPDAPAAPESCARSPIPQSACCVWQQARFVDEVTFSGPLGPGAVDADADQMSAYTALGGFDLELGRTRPDGGVDTVALFGIPWPETSAVALSSFDIDEDPLDRIRVWLDVDDVEAVLPVEGGPTQYAELPEGHCTAQDVRVSDAFAIVARPCPDCAGTGAEVTFVVFLEGPDGTDELRGSARIQEFTPVGGCNCDPD